MKNKSQGLPLNIIVLGVIGLIVLVVLVLAFSGTFTSALSDLFGFAKTATPEDLQLWISNCNTYCNSIISFATCYEFKSSRYCTSHWNTSSLNGIDYDYCYPQGGDKIKVRCRVGSWNESNCISCP